MLRPSLTLWLGWFCVAPLAATPTASNPSPSPAAEGPRCEERSPAAANARLVDRSEVDAATLARWQSLREQAARAMRVRAFAPGADPEPLTARRAGGWLEHQEALRAEAYTRAPERRADGMLELRLDGAFLEPLLVESGPDGAARIRHSHAASEER